MKAWRSLAILAAALVWAGTASAQSHSLREKDLTNCHFQITLKMNLKGEMIIQQEGKQSKLNQTAEATHDYVERVLVEGEQGMIGRAARFYKTAQVVYTVEKERMQHILRSNRRLIVAQHGKEGTLTYALKGSLTHGELDLMRHFDTLAVPGLLPQKDVAVGDTWKVHNAVAQNLCAFDGLTTHSLTCTLVTVTGTKATVAISGHASGIDGGATVNLTVDGSLQYDLEAGRVVSLRWNQKDEREQGPVSPAMKAEMNLEMTRAPAAAASEVSDTALIPEPVANPKPELLVLTHNDPKGRYTLSHGRDWVPVAQTDQHLVMRLLDRGDFVAQATVVCWPKAEAGKHMSADDFKKAMTEAPGWVQEEVAEAKEIAPEHGGWIYRMATVGKLNGLKTVQIFWLVAGPQGDQVVVAITMTPNQVAKLGTRDHDLVRSVEFPGVQKKE
jgi:hypothetical protein